MKLRSLVGCESGQHLVEDVIVSFASWRADHSGLVEEVTVDLCTIQGSVGYLDLDEMSLETNSSFYYYVTPANFKFYIIKQLRTFCTVFNLYYT